MQAEIEANKIDELLEFISVAKQNELSAKAIRHALEKDLMDLLAYKEDKSKTLNTGSYKVKFTPNYVRKINEDKLAQLTEDYSIDMLPLVYKPKYDAKKAKYLENNEPETWAYVSACIDMKRGKTTISIEEVGESND